jgi:hypothetical protein
MTLPGMLVAWIDRPAQAMREATARPRAWWLPALLLAASLALLVVVSAPYQVDVANERTLQMMDRLTARMSEEQARIVRESASQMTLPRYMLTTLIPGVLLMAIGWLLRGVVVHFSSMALGGTSTWGPTFAVVVWSMLPFAVRNLLQTAYIWFSKQAIEHEGLSFLVASGDWLKDSGNVLYAVLGRVDPFVLWHIPLLAVAITAATRVRGGKAFVMALVVWGVFTVASLIPVVLTGSFSGLLGG